MNRSECARDIIPWDMLPKSVTTSRFMYFFNSVPFSRNLLNRLYSTHAPNLWHYYSMYILIIRLSIYI
jgi:hypothetical protein